MLSQETDGIFFFYPYGFLNVNIFYKFIIEEWIWLNQRYISRNIKLRKKEKNMLNIWQKGIDEFIKKE